VVEYILGEEMERIDKVIPRPEAFEAAFAVMPEAQACLARVLREGGTFTQVRGLAGADDALVVDVCADLAARGAIRTLVDARGNDLLATVTPTDFAPPPVMAPMLPVISPAAPELPPELSPTGSATVVGPGGTDSEASRADGETPRPLTTSMRPDSASHRLTLGRPERSRWRIAVAVTAAGALLGAAFGLVMPASWRSSAVAPPVAQEVPAVTEPRGTAASLPPASLDLPPVTRSMPLPEGLQVAEGEGFLEVSAPGATRIRIDGEGRGRQPKAGAVVKAGVHEIVVEMPNEERVHFVEVAAGQSTLVEFANP
jgi:hypothetical protein